MWRDEAQQDVRELRLHGGRGGLAGVAACPRAGSTLYLSLPGFNRLSHVAVSCRSVVVVAQPSLT